ncbi:MAG: enoyl-CoA hydratase/isomerase family protein, partial [Myxococcales bacterium]|nr:enoyl-CoA hydratase/isomerase family protein [Myxococcales bacterium]
MAGLASPDAPERFSALTGDALLVIDLDSEAGSPSPAAVVRARQGLDQLPCPSVALASKMPSASARALAPHVDVLLDDPNELGDLIAAVERSPLASMALVQLLRQNERQGVHEGLISESLIYSTLQSGPEFAAWLAERPAAKPREANREPAVLVRREGTRLELTLNRSEKRNAFSAEMRDGLCEGILMALHDPGIEDITISGLGPSFCSGGDLDEFGTLPDPATAHAIRSTRNPGRLLHACADRVQARIHGACVGAGIELPAFAQRVVARPGAFVQLPEVAMGLVPGAGGSVSVLRRVGRQRTAWLALTGKRLDVETAARWGLVDDVETPTG